MEIQLITDKDQKYAAAKLSEFYKDGMIPAEKKAYLTELSNNIGPFMGVETENDGTHYLLDAASQIATLGLGFSPSVFMGTTHFLSTWTNDPTDPTFLRLKNSFHSFLLRETGWTHLDMTICNSGAESNEIALGYAYKRRKNKKAKKVLAFEGSFHGRMLISLYSTWNKSKREPFTWDGYETEFTDFAELPDSKINQEFPKNWRETWDSAPLGTFKTPEDWNNDITLKQEVDSLLKVREKFSTGEIFALIVEPMQCEGGDRYGSDRYFTALLILAKAYGVQVIFDEVQTGFHLGRSFLWHRQFCLTDAQGTQINPDYLVCAKKAQVGLVLSPHDLKRTGIEAIEQYQVASVVRGYIHALALQQSKEKILTLEEKVVQRLNKYATKYSEYVKRPRALGMSFAFDLPTTDQINAFIAKRFNHGLLYYPAGSHTLRFRLNTSYSDKDLDFLFERLEDISEEVFNGKETQFNGKTKTRPRPQTLTQEWGNLFLETKLNQMLGKQESDTNVLKKVNDLFHRFFKNHDDIEFILIDSTNFGQFKQSIQDLQVEIYEPTRQTSIDRFEVCANSKYGICLGVIQKGALKGMLFSSSLNEHPLERGVRQDEDFLDPKSLYVIDTTVSKTTQSLGLGKFLKYAQALIAISRCYNYIKGRNRDQLASSMLNINLSLGAFEQLHLREDYPDFEKYRDVIYYETPLLWNEKVNLGNRQNSGINGADLNQEFMEQQIPYLMNKVCLSNFVSENFLKHVQAIVKQAPKELRHAYTASGQSECVDKVFKSIIFNTKDTFNPKSKVLTFKGHFFGRGSFLSRTLSEPKNDPFFPVKVLDHPNKENSENVLDEIKDLIKEGKINSIWIEPIRQQDYERVPHSFLKKLKKMAHKKSVPVVFNESASQQFSYSDENYFASNDEEITPDCSFAFLGGQAGIVLCQEKYFVSQPLMMISTWDGDEHAFASYHFAMNKIIENKEHFLETRKDFQSKIEGLLSDFPVCHNVSKGRGIIAGPLPQNIAHLFKITDKGFLCDPSYSAMKDYLK